MADNWYKTDSNLEQSGHDLLDLVLADCKSRVSTKAKTKERYEIIHGFSDIRDHAIYGDSS